MCGIQYSASIQLEMVQIRSIVFLSIFALALAQNDQESSCVECRTKGRDQVCGEDGNEYTNDCEAKCQKTLIACYGDCPCAEESEAATVFPQESFEDLKDTICPVAYAPVCSRSGQTFSNRCLADKGGSLVRCEGECPCKTEESSTCHACCAEDNDPKDCATVRPNCSGCPSK